MTNTSLKPINLDQVVDIEKLNELNLLKENVEKVW